ncbi:MAG: BspA family leucine-rich repeat surface protein, partial [Promethearchaeota archaeon]
FNQPLGSWNVSRVTDMSYMFYGVALSTSNYDDLLLGWSQLTLKSGVTFDAGYSKYSKAAADARQFIISSFAWIITDGGLATESPSVPGYKLVVAIAILGIVIILVEKRKKLVKTKKSS